MDTHRRSLLVGASLPFLGGVTGCLQALSIAEEGEGPTDSPSNGRPESLQPLERPSRNSIDAQLHNRTEQSRQFHLAISNPAGQLIAQGDRMVEARSTTRLSGIANPGDSRTVVVRVGGNTTRYSVSFGVAAWEHATEGCLDITHTNHAPPSLGFRPSLPPHLAEAALEPPLDLVLRNDSSKSHTLDITVGWRARELLSARYILPAGETHAVRELFQLDGSYLFDVVCVDGPVRRTERTLDGTKGPPVVRILDDTVSLDISRRW